MDAQHWQFASQDGLILILACNWAIWYIAFALYFGRKR